MGVIAKKSKVIPFLFGGLGNQLFIYAAARRLALRSDAELVLDDVSGFVRDYRYHRSCQLDHFNITCRKATAFERFEPLSRIRRFLKRRWNNRLPYEQRSYIEQDSFDFDQRLLALRSTGTIYLEGYWQSEGYFKDVEWQIRQDLRIAPPGDQRNQEMLMRIQQRPVAVAVHVRAFDRLVDVATPHAAENEVLRGYYSRAIEEMDKRVPRAHYFVFSDRPDLARARIPLQDDRITFVDHNRSDDMAYADLWLMTKCQHFIIANSTFSWWGAWLSDNENKLVIAPRVPSEGGSAPWTLDGIIPRPWVAL